MKPIIIVMLATQVAIFLVTAFSVALRKPTAARPVPVWSGLAIALLVAGNASQSIADHHAGQAGADVLAFGGPLLMGMAIMCLLLLFRERRQARP